MIASGLPTTAMARPRGRPRDPAPRQQPCGWRARFFFRDSPFSRLANYRHSWMVNLIRRAPGVVTIAAAAVAIGLLPLPYGYYVLLRLFLCGVCLYYLTSVANVRDGE